ncbi:RHS repeat domain-containing protein [Lachnobacterium bovis]|nr:RHS repeat-associated core domain-containing protein [Lachnobacterium bovis]
MRMSNGAGALQATYGYDEFGQEILDGINTLKNALGKVADLVNPFGFVGYQRDNIADDYFAEAREYRPEEGRFSGTDVIQGTIEMPFTLNRYGYCYNNGMLMNDLNGMWPNPIKWVKDKTKKAAKAVGSAVKAAGKAVKAVGNLVKSHKRQLIGLGIQGAAILGAAALVGLTGGTAAPLVAVAASGFITGAGIELGSQYSSGKNFNEINYKEVAIQGGIGVAFSVLPGAASGLKCLSKINSHHIEAAVNGFIGAGASVFTDVREGKSGGTIAKDAFCSFAANATVSYIGNPFKGHAEKRTSVKATEEQLQTIEEQMPLLDGKEKYIAKLREKLHQKGLSRSARASIKNRIQNAMKKYKKYMQPIKEIDEEMTKKFNKWLGFRYTRVDGVGARASGDVTNFYSWVLDYANVFYNAELKGCTE